MRCCLPALLQPHPVAGEEPPGPALTRSPALVVAQCYCQHRAVAAAGPRRTWFSSQKVQSSPWAQRCVHLWGLGAPSRALDPQLEAGGEAVLGRWQGSLNGRGVSKNVHLHPIHFLHLQPRHFSRLDLPAVGSGGQWCGPWTAAVSETPIPSLPQAGGSTGLLMDLAANEKAVHADFFNGEGAAGVPSLIRTLFRRLRSAW